MISPDSFLMLIIICLFLCVLVCLGPFFASSVSCLIPFFSSMILFYVSFSLFFFSSAYSTMSFSALFAFCHYSFLFLSTLSISVSSVLLRFILHSVHGFLQDSVHLFTVGSLSFKASNLFF